MLSAAASRTIGGSPNARSTSVQDHFVFGGVLRTEIEFPELKIATGVLSPDWTVAVEYREAPCYDSVLIGERYVREERYRLFQHSTGLRLVHSHAGTFDITHRG